MTKKIIMRIFIILFAVSLIINIAVLAISIKKRNKAVPAVVMTDEKKEISITQEYLEEKLDGISELLTADYSCTAVCTIEQGEIPFINLKGFSMLFDAEVSAGIDVSSVAVEIRGDTVIMTLPKPHMMKANVDPDSIEIFDEKKALFNWSEYKDTADALKFAEIQAENKAFNSGIYNKADEQAKTVIKALFEDIIKECGMKLEIKSEADNT